MTGRGRCRCVLPHDGVPQLRQSPVPLVVSHCLLPLNLTRQTDPRGVGEPHPLPPSVEGRAPAAKDAAVDGRMVLRLRHTAAGVASTN